MLLGCHVCQWGPTLFRFFSNHNESCKNAHCANSSSKIHRIILSLFSSRTTRKGLMFIKQWNWLYPRAFLKLSFWQCPNINLFFGRVGIFWESGNVNQLLSGSRARCKPDWHRFWLLNFLKRKTQVMMKKILHNFGLLFMFRSIQGLWSQTTALNSWSP